MNLVQDCAAGGADLRAAVAGAGGRVLYVGISCGLSSPYVAAQLQLAMDEGMDTAVIGFNPVEFARDAPMQNWVGEAAATGKPSFRDVLRRLAARELGAGAGEGPGSAVVLNPVLGPEAITGSSRMKGGSATLMLLDICFTKALLVNAGAPAPSAADCLGAFEQCCRATYLSAAAGLAEAIDRAAESLSSGSRVYYVGADAAAIVGMVDLSEMADTCA